jgi:hypothetical protein
LFVSLRLSPDSPDSGGGDQAEDDRQDLDQVGDSDIAQPPGLAPLHQRHRGWSTSHCGVGNSVIRFG